MKITVKDIDKKYQEHMSACQRMIEQQANAKREADQLNREAEAAACDGNLEEYSALKNKAREAEDLAYVLEKQIEKRNTGDLFTDEEISAAWDSCAEEHNRLLNEKLKKYNATRTDMLRQYAEMVTLQRETCAIRERLGAYIGMKKEALAPDYGLGRRFPMEYIPCLKNGENGTLTIRGANIQDPDAAFYLASFGKEAQDLAHDDKAQAAVHVVGFHQSK